MFLAGSFHVALIFASGNLSLFVMKNLASHRARLIRRASPIPHSFPWRMGITGSLTPNHPKKTPNMEGISIHRQTGHCATTQDVRWNTVPGRSVNNQTDRMRKLHVSERTLPKSTASCRQCEKRILDLNSEVQIDQSIADVFCSIQHPALSRIPALEVDVLKDASQATD
ncbi:hypothetical protein VM1G_11483 [Cytospora mali]|uniref:Uncharacterized protein n=1 Tax=Cytospora mali TaxID=578113 RepID=A0A194VVU4_CYTMA|nr:hypothetical protein VM1G_11483 [Valsa mali]